MTGKVSAPFHVTEHFEGIAALSDPVGRIDDWFDQSEVRVHGTRRKLTLESFSVISRKGAIDAPTTDERLVVARIA